MLRPTVRALILICGAAFTGGAQQCYRFTGTGLIGLPINPTPKETPVTLSLRLTNVPGPTLAKDASGNIYNALYDLTASGNSATLTVGQQTTSPKLNSIAMQQVGALRYFTVGLNIPPGGTCASCSVGTFVTLGGPPETFPGWSLPASLPPISVFSLAAISVGVYPYPPAIFNITGVTTSCEENSPQAPLTITTSSLPEAASGQPYIAMLSAAGGSGAGQTWSTTSSLPIGFALSAAGILASSGRPAAAQESYSLFVAVRDSTGNTAAKQIPLVVSTEAGSCASTIPSRTPTRQPRPPRLLGHCNTLSYRTTIGGPGYGAWQREWELSSPSPSGGYVVQFVTGRLTAAGDGSSVDIPYAFWEAWRVAPGGQITVPSYDDFNFSLSTGARGTDTVTAVARFYEGLTLPASFSSHNPNTFAGSLPSTTIDPHLSIRNATPPVIVVWTVNW